MSFIINGVTYAVSDFSDKGYASIWDAFWTNVMTHITNTWSSTSVTSMTIATGSQAFTIEANKSFAIGQPVRLARTSAPTTTYMDGVVTAYTAATGAITLNIVAILGSGTHTDWTLSIGGARIAGATSPLTIAEGGTGGATALVALDNLTPAISGVMETNTNFVAQCKFGPALDGQNWDEKTSASTAKVMIATIKGGGADTTVDIWNGVTASATPLGTVTLTGAATPTSIAGAGGILIIGCEDGVRFVGIVNNAWAELTTGWPRALSTTTTPALGSNTVDDVSAFVLPGQKEPTFFVSSDSATGALVNPDGTLSNADVPSHRNAYGAGVFALMRDTSNQLRMDLAEHLVQGSISGREVAFGASTGAGMHFIANEALDALNIGPGGTGALIAAGQASGLNLIEQSTVINAEFHGAIANVNRTYNTGYMLGDIRGAWLANSVTADRSYKANTLTENGTITEAAVETGAELNGYSGFTAVNNLTRASDADWDVITTGALHMSCWVKSSSNSDGVLCGFSNAGNTIRVLLYVTSTGIQFIDEGASGSANPSFTADIHDDQWHKVDVFRVSSTERYAYFDGVLIGENTTNAGSLSSSGNLPFSIGVNPNGSSSPATTQTISEVHLAATAPSATQIRQMYDAEKGMFVASAKCLLQSATTDAVLDVDIDAITGFVTVVQTDDEAVWKGLAIHSEPTIPTGGTTWEHSVRHAGAAFTITDANFAGNVPAIAVRDVASDVQGLMGKLPSGVDLGIAKAWIYLNMSSGAIIASKNIAYVTDDGPGAFTAYFAIPFKSKGYTVSGAGGKQSTSTESMNITPSGNQPGYCSLGWTNSAGTGIDAQNFFAVFHGELENE